MDMPWVVLVTLLTLALSALGGWPLTALVLRAAARSGDAGRPDEVDEHPDEVDEHADHGPDGGAAARPPAPVGPAPLRGGTWIGILERLGVTACVLAGYPAGIAFVVAVKGLGRYPELRDHPGTSERFVIGTFASMLWAVAAGAVARLLIG
ncbi:hypothetical protein [Cellulomonas bogoriensis]|uniref:Uncharacterized protein n=1 Tax=Cellulomonas bogoriensis 69B4 = DSM 16987 TaxID=1386082 RepID=A0A0A0C4J8_9CELL|nr:hypothetical protein [Cellulomonas bogoriensis]KGM14249.1 hypothetical protein N869_00685 [Cellulomonas bogoriensis 69B4 = DSM 16987]